MKTFIAEDKNIKVFRSADYNYNFNKNNGYFERWGKTEEDDPQFSPFGPEILDIEITEKCNGVVGLDGIRKPCSFCYKNNTPSGNNMTLEEFKLVIDKMPKLLTQIALGADSTGTTNPDMFAMMEYARSKSIVPNLTIADISDEVADKLSNLAGAVAISRYEDKNICYNSVKKLTDRGMKQINIHMLVSENTYEQVLETLNDVKTDQRLEKLNCVVLLSLKKKGRGKSFNILSQDKFKSLIDLALQLKVSFGMDSCSAHKFLNAIKDNSKYKQIEQSVEPCESSCMSAYVDSKSNYFPCSFTEDSPNWNEGLKITKDTDFIKDIWNNTKTVNFRNNLIKCGRSCPIYEV